MLPRDQHQDHLFCTWAPHHLTTRSPWPGLCGYSRGESDLHSAGPINRALPTSWLSRKLPPRHQPSLMTCGTHNRSLSFFWPIEKTHHCQDQKVNLSILIYISLYVYIVNFIYSNIANIWRGRWPLHNGDSFHLLRYCYRLNASPSNSYVET